MTWSRVFIVIVVLVVGAPAGAQDVPAAEPSPVEHEAAVAPDEPAAIETAVAAPVEEAPAPCTAACASAATGSAADASSDAGWLILGIGGSIAAASVATGASLMAQGDNSEYRVGLATLTGGATGLAISLLVGLLAM